MFVLNEIHQLAHYRWSSLSIVKRTKCEINNFSIVFSAKTISQNRLHRVFISYEMKWGIYLYLNKFITSICWYDNMHAIHRRIGTEILQWFLASNFLRLENRLWCGHQRESQEGRGARVHQFVPGPVVAFRQPCICGHSPLCLQACKLQHILYHTDL
jgi:hypothetical protein